VWGKVRGCEKWRGERRKKWRGNKDRRRIGAKKITGRKWKNDTHTFPFFLSLFYLIAGVGEGMGRTWKGGGGFFFNTATNKEGMLGQSDPSASAVTHCDL
jgi:hypothetical protein